MLNFLAFIGWSPLGEEEILTPQEFINLFDIKKIHISGGKFNEEKLDWINKEHIKKLPFDKLKEYVFKWLPDELKIEKIIPIIVDRIYKFSDIKKMIESNELDFFYKEPEYGKEKLIFRNTDAQKIKDNLSEVINALNKINENDFVQENIKNILMKITENKESRGEVLHPVRFALSGLDKSPDPFILIEILGKEKTIKRLDKAISLL
jgi:glutamyl/glutaminyl-tRNA synthetase